MSTVKKLSLSGFKSTFKRKTSRGSSTKCNAQQTQTVPHYVCENESSKTNGEYQHVGLKNGIAGRSSDDFINKNRGDDDIRSLEIKTSRWGFRQKSGKSENCVNYNGDIDLVNANDPGDVKHSVPGSGEIGGNSSSFNQRPPLANGHVLVDVQSTNQNIKSGYVGAKRSSQAGSAPQLANGHAFHDANSVGSGGAHDYINDSRKTGSCVNGQGADFSRKTQIECDREISNKSVGNHYEIHHPISISRGLDNAVHDINENAEDFGGKFSPDNEESEDVHQNRGSNDKFDSEDISDEPPPAIPPKPAKLFSNGQWTLKKKNANEPEVENDDVSSEDRLPPRPPARSKTRCVIDTSLPFYKQYLEMKEKAFQTPIYEDVQLEQGPCSGGLAGELSKLPRQPWYWGPMSQDEAEEKLTDAADGSFLVRDSSDERYLLTLSFRSSGRTLHTRIEHRNGLFSLHDSEGHASVIQLIHNAVTESQNGVYGYMNDSTGIQNYPARLTHWVSRYSEVKSLQYLCRFVIRETFPRHHIRKLPLPNKINEYILENQY